VPVSGNWNWIGFPRLEPEPVNDVLGDLNNVVTGNILKSQTQFSSYNQSSDSWLGNLNFFNPGEGYKLFLSNPGTIFFEPSRSDGFEANPFLYEYNMNVNGMANLNIIGEEDEEEMIVGAFIDGVCRGTGTFEYNTMLRKWRVVMLVNGNTEDLGKEIEFRFKNETTGAEYITNGDQLTFVADGIMGTIEDPYDFFGFSTATEEEETEEAAYSLEQNKPNPTSGLSQVGFQIPVASDVTLTVYDVNGIIVTQPVNKHMAAGKHSITLDMRPFAKGIYFYELKTNEFTASKKLVRN
jgi:hypothetical protein